MAQQGSNLRRIRDFKTDKATELRRQLVELEDNVSDMGARLAQASMQPLRVATRESSSDLLTVRPGQSLGILASVSRVQLEKPLPGDSGKFLAICKGAGTAANTDVMPPSGTKLNDGSSAYTITTAGVMLLVYCDGINYWTV